MWLVNTLCNSTLVWQCLLLGWWRVQADTDPMSGECWASVTGASQYPFSLVSTSCWRECLHIAYTAPMPFKCWSALYTMAQRRTNARYTDTLPGQLIVCLRSFFRFKASFWYIYQNDALNQSWVNAGPPSVYAVCDAGPHSALRQT